MDPAFIDGRTHEYTAAGAQSLLRYEQEGGVFFGFYRDNGRDVGALLHAREQTFFNAVASPKFSETPKM